MKEPEAYKTTEVGHFPRLKVLADKGMDGDDDTAAMLGIALSSAIEFIESTPYLVQQEQRDALHRLRDLEEDL